MPAAIEDAPDAGLSSTTDVDIPRCAQRHAIERPMAPPPTTIRSGMVILSLRRH
jgi:hypothetical protein